MRRVDFNKVSCLDNVGLNRLGPESFWNSTFESLRETFLPFRLDNCVLITIGLVITICRRSMLQDKCEGFNIVSRLDGRGLDHLGPRGFRI